MTDIEKIYEIIDSSRTESLTLKDEPEIKNDDTISNASALKQGLDFIKENEALTAVIIAICGAIFSLINKYIEYYLASARFSKFNIPNEFFDNFVSRTNVLLWIFEFLTLAIGIFFSYLILYNISKKREKHKFIYHLLVVVLVSIPMSLWNVFYVVLHESISVWEIILMCVIMGMTESMCGEFIILRINRSKNGNKLSSIIFAIAYVFFSFFFSFILVTSFSPSSANDYMIGRENETSFVIVCVDNDYAITEKCRIVEEKKNKVMYVDTSQQKIIALDNLKYENTNIDKTVWEGNK